MNTNSMSSIPNTKTANLCNLIPAPFRLRQAFILGAGFCMAFFMMPHLGQAASVWEGSVSQSWLDAGNWSSAPSWNNTTDLEFNASSSNSSTSSPSFLGSARTVRSIAFGADADTDLMILLATTAADTTAANAQMGSNTGTASIVVNAGATGNFQLGNAQGVLRLDSNLLVDHSGSGNLTIRAISVPGAGQIKYITKNGSGTLVLGVGGAINYLYQGGLVLNSGTVITRNNGSTLGTTAATLALNGGVLKFMHSGDTNFGRNTTVSGDSKIITSNFSGGAGLLYTLGTLAIGSQELSVEGAGYASGNGQVTFGATTLTGNAVLNVTKPSSGTGATNLNLAAVGDGGLGYGLTKNGNGNLTVNGTSTFTGQAFVNAGRLIIGTAGAMNSASSVSVASGAALTNSNSSTALTTAMILNSGAVLSGAGSFAPVSMTLVADLAGGNASFSSISAGATNLAKSGAMEFTLSNITDGSYVIFSGSALSGSFSSVTVGGTALADLGSGNFGGTAGGFDYAFTNSTNTLGITTVPEPTTWVLLGLGGVFLIFRVQSLVITPFQNSWCSNSGNSTRTARWWSRWLVTINPAAKPFIF